MAGAPQDVAPPREVPPLLDRAWLNRITSALAVVAVAATLAGSYQTILLRLGLQPSPVPASALPMAPPSAPSPAVPEPASSDQPTPAPRSAAAADTAPSDAAPRTPDAKVAARPKAPTFSQCLAKARLSGCARYGKKLAEARRAAQCRTDPTSAACPPATPTQAPPDSKNPDYTTGQQQQQQQQLNTRNLSADQDAFAIKAEQERSRLQAQRDAAANAAVRTPAPTKTPPEAYKK